MPTKQETGFLTSDELAVKLRRKVKTIYNMASRGELPRRYKVNGRMLYKESDIDAWLEGFLDLDATGLDCGEQ